MSYGWRCRKCSHFSPAFYNACESCGEKRMTFGINYSDLSGRILIGRLSKGGDTFHSKEDHTMAAMLEVARHVLGQHGGEVDLTPALGDGPAYRVTVQRIDGNVTNDRKGA